MMALSIGLLSIEARKEISPASLLCTLNSELRPHTLRNKKNTALSYLRLFPQNNHNSALWDFSVANAGLIAPLLRKADGSVEWLDVNGLPLGMIPNAEYTESQGKLEACDLLVLGSDGLVEAMNSDGEIYGFERLTDCVAKASFCNAQALQQHILEDVLRFTGDAEPHDDVTLVVVVALPDELDESEYPPSL